MTHRCPRRSENPIADDLFPDPDDWRTGRHGIRTCSYCGSLSPETFFAYAEAGCMVDPTDKNYKVYIHPPNPDVGKIVEYGSDSGAAFDRHGNPRRHDLTDEEKATGRYNRTLVGPASATLHEKFYFQHFSEDDRQRFIQMANAKKFNLAFPGRFYVTPYFCTVVQVPPVVPDQTPESRAT